MTLSAVPRQGAAGFVTRISIAFEIAPERGFRKEFRLIPPGGLIPTGRKNDVPPSKRHGPAGPGHRSHPRVDADGPVEPGHDGLAVGELNFRPVGIIPCTNDRLCMSPRLAIRGLAVAANVSEISGLVRRTCSSVPAHHSPGQAGTVPSRMSRTRSNLRALVAADCRSPCSRRRTGRRLSASSRSS
jgi:hypothetical protein